MSFGDSRGRGWEIDPDGAAHVIRSNHYNRLLVERSKLVRKDMGEGFFDRFLLPTVTEVDTDFTNIREATTREASVTVGEISNDYARDPERLYEFLVSVREDAEDAGGHYRRMVQQASAESARSINSNVDCWENSITAAKFARDASAGILFVGATIVSGGTAAALTGVAATGLTFTGGTQDNLQSGQTMEKALGNAAISTSITVVTSLLVPKALGAVGKGMLGAGTQLTMGQNVVVGLLSVQANLAGDVLKTALTADAPTTEAMRQEASQQFQRQIGARTGVEIANMLFGAWLESKGIPAHAFLTKNGDVIKSVAGGVLGAVGDRIVTAMSQQDKAGKPGMPAGDLDLLFTRLQKLADAEAYVRKVAMRPV